MRRILAPSVAIVAVASLTFGAVSYAFPVTVTRVIVRTHTDYRTRTIIRWKTRTVTGTVSNAVPSGIPETCGQELWQAWAGQAPVAADMMNVAPSTVPACVPYLSQIDGG